MQQKIYKVIEKFLGGGNNVEKEGRQKMALHIHTQLCGFFLPKVKTRTFVTVEESRYWKMSYSYIQVQFIY